MEITIPFGHSSLTAQIPSGHPVDIIEAPNPPAVADPNKAVQMCLDHLLGHRTWSEFRQVKSVAIAVNDKTRPVPHHLLLPPLMKSLAALDIPDSAITFYVAVGTHPPMTPDEFGTILPAEILQRYQVISHNAEDEQSLIYLGVTSHGTPIWSNKGYVSADLKIVVGNIEPHQFAGFSGGVKSAAIGLSGLETINTNHSLLIHPDSLLGEYDNNPSRQDIEEIGQRIGVHLALNAILNQNREIIHVLAGDPRQVVREGIVHSRLACQAHVRHPYGLVISSPGGHPKDINIYQAQKGLAHAALITRPGGTVILTAACPEGSGSAHYETWTIGKKSNSEIINRFIAEGFRIGPHKAYQIARDALKVNFLFYTTMDHELARTLLLNPIANLQTAIDMAVEHLEPGEPIGILPHATSTIPYIKEVEIL
jgi:nickel-dependent lactate racemase